MNEFTFLYLPEAIKFLRTLSIEEQDKVSYNVKIAKTGRDPRLMKKLQAYIWELRVNCIGKQIRFLVFWDKDDNVNTLIVATHGFTKKVGKVPAKEIERATKIRLRYFEQKNKK